MPRALLGQQQREYPTDPDVLLFTRVRKNMKSLPISMIDNMLLNRRTMAETIIGQIKGFSSLNLPKHRLPINGFLHILATITVYQINPIKPEVAFYSPHPPAITL